MPNESPTTFFLVKWKREDAQRLKNLSDEFYKQNQSERALALKIESERLLCEAFLLENGPSGKMH